MKIKSIGETLALDSGYHIWDNPIIKINELKEEIVDETKRLEPTKELYGPNATKDPIKGKVIDILF